MVDNIRNIAPLEADSAKKPTSDKVLEAPGRFVSRDMLARTPLCHPSRLEDDHDASEDESFPPPPPSEELKQPQENSSNPEAVRDPDMDHPPPPESPVLDVTEAEKLHHHRDPVQDNVSETPDVRESRKLPTG